MTRPAAMPVLFATALCLGAAACGGGGGGASEAPSAGSLFQAPGSNPTPPASPPPPLPPPPPSGPRAGVDYPMLNSNEYTRNWGLAAIKVEEAWARGATGQGIKVAVVDTGIDMNHADLRNNISGQSRDLDTGRNSMTITAAGRHGTQVAGVIGHQFNGQGTVGVAFQSSILAYRADMPGTCEQTGGCKMLEPTVVRGIDQAIADGARVINLSLGGPFLPGIALYDALQRATDAGIVVVAAAGNRASYDTDYPARLAADPRYRGLIIAAGSVDQNEQLSSFSARAGSTAQNFLMAPGGIGANGNGIVADCSGATCVSVQGTSFSAPHISGAVALLLHAFPNLSGRDAAQILLDSARDLGDSGTDQVFGRGMLDLGRAFQPLGVSQAFSASGTAVNVTGTTGSTGGPFGPTLFRDGLVVAVTDSWGRPFNVRLADGFAPAAVAGLAAMPMDEGGSRDHSAGPVRLNWTPRLAPSPAWGGPRAERGATARFRAEIDLGAGAGAAPGAARWTARFASADGMVAPMNAAEAGQAFGISALAGAGASGALAWQRDGLRLEAMTGQGRVASAGGLGGVGTSLGAVRMAWQGARFSAGLEAGGLSEAGAVWGTRWRMGRGARSDAASQSAFAGFGLGYDGADAGRFSLRVQAARMDALAGGDLFELAQRPLASAWSLGWTRPARDGALRVTLGQPLRIERGALALQLAGPYTDWHSAPAAAGRLVNLAPDGREWRLNAGRDWMFTAREGREAWFGFDVTLVRDPGHDATAEPLALASMRAGARF